MFNSPPAKRWWLFVVLSVLTIVAAHLLDTWIWAHVRDPKVYDRDWGRMLRSAGYLPTWLIVAIGLWTHDKPKKSWGWRGALMILVPTASGALAELLKLVVRRLRPGDTSAAYVFRPVTEDTWSTRGLGMPSSHVLVAMGAATVLSRLFPRAWWLWYLVAAGCAYTRLLANAHFFSDVVVASILGWLVGDITMRWAAKKIAFANTIES